MYLAELLVFLVLACGASSDAGGCEIGDCFQQLIQSVQAAGQQRNGPQCGSASNPRVGKAGPKGPPGQRGPPGHVDMVAVEQLVQRMINENVYSQVGFVELCYVGMKSRVIPDSAITASSFAGPPHEPYHGRLDNLLVAGNAGAWASGRNAVGQWLQVDLQKSTRLAGVLTQGRSLRYNQWVRSYKVSCGEDNGSLTFVQENGHDKVFQANSDKETKVYNRFAEVISCRFVRIYPQSWNGHMSMRVEFIKGACYDHVTAFL